MSKEINDSSEQLYAFTFYEALRLTLKLNDTTYSYWRFYAAGIIVCAGWLLSSNHEFTQFIKWLLTLSIIVLTALSLIALQKVYRAINATITEFQAMLNSVRFYSDEMQTVAENAKVSQLWQVCLIHSLAAILILILIWTPKTQLFSAG